MKKADREALRKRVWARLYETGVMADRIANFCVREVDRAARRERSREEAELDGWLRRNREADSAMVEKAKRIEDDLQEAEQLEFKRSKGER